MSVPSSIPVFTLFGETEQFPDVVHCERFSARAPGHGWRISAHRHRHMAQLFLIDRGRVDAKVDGLEICLRDGEFLYISAQTAHEFVFEPNTKGYVLSFPLMVLNSIGPASPDLLTALAEPFTGTIDAPLEQLTNLLADSVQMSSPYRAQRAVGLAHSVLSHLADLSVTSCRNSPQPISSRLSELDELILLHMAENWTASDYAADLSVSTGHLSRLCRSATGQGLTAYIQRGIMEEACRLLAFTLLPVSDVGYRVGFSDPSYFSRRFRAVRGMTPSEYRAQFAT
ncbi:MAG: helix-turn-helix domain-containing protein [Pseudomonadota bacterium]